MNMRDSVAVRMHAFGYPCHLVVGDTDGSGNRMLELATAELARLESRFSSFDPRSLVAAINESAGDGHFTALDAEARSLLDYVKALWHTSEYRFDPSVSLLQDCYATSLPRGKIASCVASRLPHVGWARVEINDQGARLPAADMFIDLNSCIRPYVVDRVRKKLLESGVSSALIDLDRDIATIGKQTDGSNWMLAVRHPRGSRTAIARIKLNDGAIAIRGDFERCLQLNGERFGRALNPADGRPIPGLLSVAVTAASCVEACSAATLARMKDEADALPWLVELGLPWMGIDRNLECHGPLTPATAY